jgi:hypothetical protein
LTVYLPPTPDGRPAELAPYVLTEAEVLRLFRMEVEDPYSALRRYRGKGLKGTQLGKNVRYQLPDVLDFLERQRDANPR